MSFLSLLLLLVIAPLATAVMNEALDWSGWVAKRLIARAARILPTKEARDRYEAEWLAELAALPAHRISALLFALRVLIRAPNTRLAVDPASPSLFSVGRRSFDLVASSALLSLMLPSLANIAVMILLTSGRPIFHRTVVVGARGEPVAVLSFAPDAKSALGRMLRRYDLDQLPGLINVIRGELSLVGPKPKVWSAARRAHVDGRKSRRPGLISRAPSRHGL